jgi:hypothetical protein
LTPRRSWWQRSRRALALGANQFSCRGGRGAGSGFDLATIDAVAFTHLDGDRTGWVFSQEQDGTYRKTFPVARYLIARADDAESCMASVTISATAGLARYPAPGASDRLGATVLR